MGSEGEMGAATVQALCVKRWVGGACPPEPPPPPLLIVQRSLSFPYPISTRSLQVFSATLTRTDFEPEEWRGVLTAPEPAFALVPVCSLLPTQCLDNYEAAGGDIY